VPAAGLGAWNEPDANRPQAARLTAGLDVEVIERWGDWARIVCSNGWTAWTDGRVLEPLAGAAGPAPSSPRPAAAPAAARPAGGSLPSFLRPAGAGSGRFAGEMVLTRKGQVAVTPGLIGVAAAAIAIFLPWLDVAGVSSNSFDIPAAFLFDREAAPSSVDLGIVLLAAVVAGAVGVLMPGREVVRLAAGAALLLIAALYMFQLNRYLSLFGDDAPGLFSTVGFGVWITAVAAIPLLVRIPERAR
jgi:hypothetical protein